MSCFNTTPWFLQITVTMHSIDSDVGMTNLKDDIYDGQTSRRGMRDTSAGVTGKWFKLVGLAEAWVFPDACWILVVAIHPSIHPFICIRQHGPYHNRGTREKPDRKDRTVQKVTVQKTNNLTTTKNTQKHIIQSALNVNNPKIFYQIVGTVLPRASK